MEIFELVKEFWGPLLAFSVVLVAGAYLIFKLKKHGLTELGFAGKTVEEIGVVNAEPDRPNDKIIVYRLIDKNSNHVSWCLKVITKSRKFHGVGRMAGEIPLFLEEEEMSSIIETLSSR